MTNEQEMRTLSNRYGFGNLILLLFICLESSGPACFAVQSKDLEWKPRPLDEIRSICESKELSDLEIVRALVDHLDRRISMSRCVGRMKHRPNPAYEYGTLIGLIAEGPYPAKPKGRPEVIETVIDSLGVLENERDVRTYLYISLGLAGGRPPESEILGVLEDPETPEEIIAVTLDSMSRSEVPIRSLPRLLELSDHPMSHIYSPGVGPPAPRRVHPIRERVFSNLLRLGIRCEKHSRADEDVHPVAQKRLATTVLEVDGSSMASRVRDWLLDDDPAIWHAAIDITSRLPDENVAPMIRELRATGLLSQEKLAKMRQ